MESAGEVNTRECQYLKAAVERSIERSGLSAIDAIKVLADILWELTLKASFRK